MALCHPCSDVLRFAIDRLNTIHSTSQSFLAAVDEGCYICHGLFCQLPEERKQDLRRRGQTCEPPPVKRRRQIEDYWLLTWYQKDLGNTRSGSIRLDLRMTDLNSGASFEIIGIPEAPLMSICPVRTADDECLVTASLPWTVASYSTNSEETFSKIKSWLDRCDKTHSKCRIRRDEADVSWHPTRLIQITAKTRSGDKLEVEDLMCRIVEPKSDIVPQDLRYITLSHRWPQNQRGFQKLTVGKLPHWKASLPVKRMRRTFQDAFLVAQKFGITYVWIDSLCIIQEGDSFADWKRESPMMQKVYSHAEFNICASKIDNREGLFSPREPSNFQSLQIKLFEDDDSIGNLDHSGFLTDNDHSGHYLITNKVPITAWNKRMNDSILAPRGWIFQEQLLSRANLHFGNHEVFFECLEMRASESLGSDQDYEVPWKENHVFFKEHLPILESMGAKSCRLDERNNSNCDDDKLDGDSYKRWHELLSQYTTLELTDFEDRLVALSGVAQHFKKFFSRTDNDLYIAGLWQSRLVTELLWQLADSTSREEWYNQKRRRKDLTFSWLSVKEKIENQADRRSHLLSSTPLVDIKVIRYRMPPDIVDSTQQPFAEDLFSLPSTPTIEVSLTGFLRPMKLYRLEGLEKQRIMTPVDSLLDGDFDLRLSVGGHSGLKYTKTSYTGETMLDFEISSGELKDLRRSYRLFFMPFLHEEPHGLWLLLLELVGNNDGNKIDTGRFRRIGVHYMNIYSMESLKGDDWLFSFIGTETMEESYASALGIYEGVSELPRWEYDRRYPRPKKQTIFLV